MPSKPLRVTSRLNGRAYAAAGQASGFSYQADLLKDPDKGQGPSPDEVAELRRTTDLALRVTKQTRSMLAMVVTERHLCWSHYVKLSFLGIYLRVFK